MDRSRVPYWGIGLLAGLLTQAGTLAAQFTRPPPPAAYALQGVTLVRSDGTRLEGVNLVVRHGRIEALGPDLEPPRDAKILEGDSLFVYPGLVDAQGGADYDFPEVEVDRSQVASWNPPRHVQGFMPHRRVVDHLNATGADLADQRRQGVVAAAVHPAGSVMPGRGTLILFRGDAEEPEQLVIDPALGPVMTFRPASNVYPSTLFAVIAFYRQTFEDARHLEAQMQAYRRSPDAMASPAWDPDFAVIQEVMSRSAPVFFAVDLARDIRRALSLAREYGFGPVIVGGEEAWKVADELKAAGVPVLVSLDFPKPDRWKPEKKKAEPDEKGNETGEAADDAELDAAALREKERIENIYSNAGRLAAAGVSFALTSGGGKADLLEGARRAIEYGLPESEALRALTATPASLLGIDHLARIREGASANFIVTDGPLFEEGSAIRYTFVEGVLEEGKKAAGTGEPPAVDMTGAWDFTVETSQGSFTFSATFSQKGAAFDGTFRGQFGESRVVDGVVSGNEISFTNLFSLGGRESEIDYEGTVEGDSASGTGQGSPAGSFTWTATRTGGPEREGER